MSMSRRELLETIAALGAHVPLLNLFGDKGSDTCPSILGLFRGEDDYDDEEQSSEWEEWEFKLYDQCRRTFGVRNEYGVRVLNGDGCAKFQKLRVMTRDLNEA